MNKGKGKVYLAINNSLLYLLVINRHSRALGMGKVMTYHRRLRVVEVLLEIHCILRHCSTDMAGIRLCIRTVWGQGITLWGPVNNILWGQ